jgi:hypothetical protein
MIQFVPASPRSMDTTSIHAEREREERWGPATSTGSQYCWLPQMLTTIKLTVAHSFIEPCYTILLLLPTCLCLHERKRTGTVGAGVARPDGPWTPSRRLLATYALVLVSECTTAPLCTATTGATSVPHSSVQLSLSLCFGPCVPLQSHG